MSSLPADDDEESWSTEELNAFGFIISALNRYREVSSQRLIELSKKKIRENEELIQMLSGISANADLCEAMLMMGATFGPPGDATVHFPPETQPYTSQWLNQITAVLQSCARDWTSIGDQERLETYKPIIDALQQNVSRGSSVFIPGSGLSRLAVEIAHLGYHVDVNEIAYTMHLATMIAFNQDSGPYPIYPFIHQAFGLNSVADAMINAVFPTSGRCINCLATGQSECHCLTPIAYVQEKRLNLHAGQFERFAAKSVSTFKAVVTCFFIDVVKDYKKAIQLIFNTLQVGGVWINFGPTIMHQADDEFFPGCTLEDIVTYAKRIGFTILKQEKVTTSYCENPKNTIKTKYACELIVCRK